MAEPRPALTVADLMRELQGWIDKDAKFADYPVMILDLHENDTGEGEVWDCLATDVDPDKFDEEQGPVMLLTSDPFPVARGR